jgi:hypothetical protein
MTPRASTPVYGALVAMLCAALMALGLVDADGANAAAVSAGAAVVGSGGPVDAETMVLHPPLGTPNIGAFEQLTFTFSDLPGLYTQSYAAGQHEFTGNGYHGSWTGTMTVQVGP